MSFFTNGCKEHSNTYKIYHRASTLLSLAAGLLGPFLVIHVESFGDAKTLGNAFALMIAANAITSFYAGKFADHYGRKPLMLAAGYAQVAAIFGYTLISSVTHLNFLQIAIGVIAAIRCTAGEALVGDITERETRGADIGRLQLIPGMTQAAALVGAGFLVESFGVKFIFYPVVMIQLVAVTTFFFIDEPRNR